MLAQSHRLRRHRDFAGVYQQGQRWTATHLILRGYRRAQLDPLQQTPDLEPLPQSAPPDTRIGIVVSQKVSKRAVVRNRIKRQLRAACRTLLPDLQLGWDLVIVVRSPTPKPVVRHLPPSEAPMLKCDYQQFLQELKQLLAEAGIFHGH